MKTPINPGEFWDKHFGHDEYRYGTKPNDFLQRSLAEYLPAGASVLSVGDGEGRNGVFCARQGYPTTSLEPSKQGCKKIRALADQMGVDIAIINDMMPSQQIAPESFEAVVLIYIHTPPDARTTFHRHCIDALHPGGLIFLEGFRPEQRLNQRTSGGPPDIDMLFTREILENDFQDLKILHLNEETRTLDEGPGHRGPGDVVNLIARKR